MTATRTPPDSLFAFGELEEPACPDFRFEEYYWNAGHRLVAGVDEAGRGPLAGPVVAAAVILGPDFAGQGLNDSKKLTAAARDALYSAILASARAVSVASICAQSIDRSDIRKASLAAMRHAVYGLCIGADTALFDGRDIPSGLRFRVPPRAIVKGDGRSLSIAAASVVAKVTRDRMMKRLGSRHDGYGLEQHMGYGSSRHREAIRAEGGIARVHRFTFSPLKFRT